MALIIVLLLLFSTATVYYQQKIKSISTEYNEKNKQLEEMTGNIVLSKINETIKLKETSEKDKVAFEKSYSELKIENENLRNEKEELQSELNTAKSDLEHQKSQFDLLKERFDQVQNALISSNEKISGLILKINEIEAKSSESCNKK